MFEEREAYAPLVLFEYDHKPGHFCLMLTDVEMARHEALFERHGRTAHGYGWTDMTCALIDAEAPELKERLDFDPEAGTFVAYGEDLEALQALASHLHRVFHDPSALEPHVANAPWEWD